MTGRSMACIHRVFTELTPKSAFTVNFHSMVVIRYCSELTNQSDTALALASTNESISRGDDVGVTIAGTDVGGTTAGCDGATLGGCCFSGGRGPMRGGQNETSLPVNAV